MLTYDEAIDFIHSRMKFGCQPGMERITALCEALGNPQDELKFVHVAGTNGKGSVCNMIASVLTDSGYKTGLFTSPYVVDFRERIQIDFEMIPKERLAEIIGDIKKIIPDLESKNIFPTEFEVITAAAFRYFLQEKCDIVVLETGLGGTLDSTNIIRQSEVSVITSISMDHTDILGSTLKEIAEHKCGIIKENGTVVSYPQPDFMIERLIRERAKEKNCEFVQSELSRIRLIRQELDGSDIIYAGCTFRIPLPGKHQLYNFSTAAAAINVLKQKGYTVTMKNLIDGIAKVKIPARVQIISREPLVIVDGGHNAEGIDALCDYLKSQCSDKEIIAVFGMMKDKNYKYCVEKLAPMCERIYTTTPSNPRSMKASELAAEVKPYCKGKVKAVSEPCKAYEKALKKAGNNTAVIVSGSLYLASDVINGQK